MRIRYARWIAGAFAIFAARGCYSSVAPVPKIDPGSSASSTSSSSGGIPDTDASCVPRKPWEGPGVTGVLPIGASTALVLSGDRYFKADFDTSGTDAGDPTLGTVKAWHETGMLADLWSDAPAVVGQKPWDDPGVTSVYISKSGPQVIISRFRRWVHDGTQWPLAGSVVDDWLVNDAGPPPVPADGGRVPWEGPGVTATYFTPSGDAFWVISKDAIWMRDTSDNDPKNWSWTDAGSLLKDSSDWQKASPIGGQHPWDGNGVTAAYYVGPKLFVISSDRMWVWDGGGWASRGSDLLSKLSDWGDAPTADCK